MTKEDKEWIDNASYYNLLSLWRTAPVGHWMFQGDTGEYYSKVMKEKREADPAAATQASKDIGW